MYDVHLPIAWLMLRRGSRSSPCSTITGRPYDSCLLSARACFNIGDLRTEGYATRLGCHAHTRNTIVLVFINLPKEVSYVRHLPMRLNEVRLDKCEGPPYDPAMQTIEARGFLHPIKLYQCVGCIGRPYLILWPYRVLLLSHIWLVVVTDLRYLVLWRSCGCLRASPLDI